MSCVSHLSHFPPVRSPEDSFHFSVIIFLPTLLGRTFCLPTWCEKEASIFFIFCDKHYQWKRSARNNGSPALLMKVVFAFCFVFWGNFAFNFCLTDLIFVLADGECLFDSLFQIIFLVSIKFKSKFNSFH